MMKCQYKNQKRHMFLWHILRRAKRFHQVFLLPRLNQKIPTSSPTASRRSRQIFLTLAASLGFQTHKGDVKCAFLQGDLDEQRVDDGDDDNNFKIESAQPVSDTFCGVTSKVAIGASSVYSIVEGRVLSCQCSKKMVPPCCD